MVLRKPYAFLIKHFKLIHLVMFLCMGILLYQTNTLLTFYNDFILSSQVILGTEVSDVIFGNYIYIFPVIIVLISVIIFVLMSFKEKPRLYYALNIIGYVALIVLYIYASATINKMQIELVDERIIRAIRDFLNIIFIFQIYSIFIAVIRSIGLDVRKFEFSQDAEALNITDKDNEEFEVNVEFDSQTLKRNVKRRIRNFKYYFIENKLFIAIISIILVLTIGLTLFFNLRDKTIVYQVGQPFIRRNYNIMIVDSYLASNDSRENLIDSNSSFVVAKFKIKTPNKTEKFIYGKLALKIGDKNYYHTIDYSDKFSDLGETYINQILNSDYKEYLLVYKIPNGLKNEKMNLIYTEQIVKGMFKTTTDDLKVPIRVTNLDEKKEETRINLNESKTIASGLLAGYELKLLDYSLDNSFKVNYNKCVTTNECYTYYEFLQPSISGISDKALLKIKLNLTIPETGSIKNVESLITKFGTIRYKINNEEKIFSITRSVNKIHNDGNDYFEIKKEILDASEVSLVITVRNDKYVFKLK